MSLKFALAGNPNSGKTTLFNQLTGSTARVGNWPGVTVERKEGKYKKAGTDISVIDLPGIYSLSPYSPEEIVARNYIVNANPDVIINIVDATNLERNLYLSTQILETDVPVVIALNMIDMVEKNQDSINVKELEKVLGVPIVAISASQKKGIELLMEKAIAVSKSARKGTSVLERYNISSELDQAKKLVEEKKTNNSLYYAVKVLENDEKVMEELSLSSLQVKTADEIRVKSDKKSDGDTEAKVADLRYQFITKHCSPLVKRSQRTDELSPSDKIDRVLTHRIWGIPIFIAIMFFVFHLTFTEDLFFLGALTGGRISVPGPGILLATGVEKLVEIGTDGMAKLLENIGASAWATSLVVEGIFAGVGAVLGFLPLVLLLYLFISILEASGYMARAAFIMDRLLRKFGLSGKSFVPMLMGFGCSVPAIAATKTIENERDRRLTIMLVPFMSCGAKLNIYAFVVPVFFKSNADLVITGLYLLGIVVAIVAGIILKKTVFKGEPSPFIMELPPYRAPSAKNLGLLILEKFKGFATKVGTIITVATVIIWFLANFGFDGGFGMVDANSAHSLLGYIGNAIKFIFMPLGFADGPDGWKAAVAIVTGLVAKEAVVSTMGQLYTGMESDALENESVGAALGAALISTFSIPAALSFLVFNLFVTPCMAAVGVMRAELNSRKYFWGTMLFHFAVAWVMSFAVYHIAKLFVR